MELEKLVMTELESMDLNDIEILELLCDEEMTMISFESSDQKIDFTIQNDGTIQVTTLTKNDQVYTDEESLNKDNEWWKNVEYIRDIVIPIIEKCQAELTVLTETTSNKYNKGENEERSEAQYEELVKVVEGLKQEVEELKRGELPQKPPATKKEKVLAVIGNIAFYLTLITVVLGVALFGLQEPGTAPRSLLGHAVMTVLSGSMEPTIPQHSLVILREVDTNTLEIGDVVTYLTPNNITITHRITEIIENYQGGGLRGFRLQGDNNLQEDDEVIWAENVIGEIIYANLFFGQIVLFIQEYIVLIVIFIALFVALVYVIKKFFLNQDSPTTVPAFVNTATEDKAVQEEICEPSIEKVENQEEEGLKKKKFKDQILLLAIGIVSIVFFYSIIRLVIIGRTYQAIEATSANLRADYTQILETEDEESIREFLQIDWEGLLERNEDVIAWLYVPGTNVNYPILAGETNEEYLSLDINRQHSIAGSIFLEENNAPTFLDLNTIIHGHNMANGSKFSDIDNFATGDIATADAPYVYLYLANGTVNIYQIVSAQLADIYSEIYNLPVMDLEGFYKLMLEGNVLDVSFDKEEQFRVLTLSTCAELGINSPLRSVVFAILVEEELKISDRSTY